MAAFCWELRGCYEDEEMNSRCPHNIPGEPCHVVARDVLTILNPDLKYDAAVKEVCRMCENFLLHGPLFAEGELRTPARQGNPSRFLL